MESPLQPKKKTHYSGAKMTKGYTHKNPCIDCPERKKEQKKVGSTWKYNQYFFMLEGVQFSCYPFINGCWKAKKHQEGTTREKNVQMRYMPAGI
jgi:hypothetical protein